jgi:5'-3' exonuclease
MLGLSTHEPHFYILRESVEQDNTQQKGGQRGRGRGMSRGGHGGQHGHYKAEQENDAPKQAPQVKFQYCKIAVVREYLYLEFKDLKIPTNLWNFERIVDDFVFLCFLVGNDFLPHLPSLVIREGALDAIIFMYKNLLPSLGGYLTNGKGGLLRSNVDVFFNELTKVEEAFFKQHEKNAKFNEDRRKQDE